MTHYQDSVSKLQKDLEDLLKDNAKLKDRITLLETAILEARKGGKYSAAAYKLDSIKI